MLWYVSKTGKSVPLMWLALLTIWDAPFENQHVSKMHLHIWKSSIYTQFKTFPRAKKSIIFQWPTHLIFKVKSQPYQLSVCLSRNGCWIIITKITLIILMSCHFAELTCNESLLRKVPKLSWETGYGDFALAQNGKSCFFPSLGETEGEKNHDGKTVFDI